MNLGRIPGKHFNENDLLADFEIARSLGNYSEPKRFFNMFLIQISVQVSQLSSRLGTTSIGYRY